MPSKSMYQSLRDMMTDGQREQQARVAEALRKDPTLLNKPLQGEEVKDGKADK